MVDSAPKSLRSLEHELSLTWPAPREYVWAEVVSGALPPGLVRIVEQRGPLRWLGPKFVLAPAGHEARERATGRIERTGSLFASGGLAGGLTGSAMGAEGYGDRGGGGEARQGGLGGGY